MHSSSAAAGKATSTGREVRATLPELPLMAAKLEPGAPARDAPDAPLAAEAAQSDAC